MLNNIQPTDTSSYGFRFKADHQNRIIGIYSLGWEKQTSKSYDWDGLARKEYNLLAFQYTIRGKGEIRIEKQTYSLNPGDAFFVKIPSDHRYYLPEDSRDWEFMQLTLYGEEAQHFFEKITNEVGHIIKLDSHDKPINIMSNLFEKASKAELKDAFEASSLAFSFVMELYRHVFNMERPTNKEWPKPISNAVNFINHNYQHSTIGLDKIVEASGLSKYHFTRLFHKTTNTTPIQYLTKIRINKAMDLLKNQNLSVEEIALSVGFTNGNYFSKVFRSYLGISPRNYRKSKSFVPVDHLILDY